MARIPQQLIDEIREKANIVDVVGQYVQLKKPVKITQGSVRFTMKKHLHFQ